MKLTMSGLPSYLAISIAIITCAATVFPLLYKVAENYFKTEYDTLFMSISEMRINKVIKFSVATFVLFIFYIYCTFISGFIHYIIIVQGNMLEEVKVQLILIIIEAIMFLLSIITLIIMLIGVTRKEQHQYKDELQREGSKKRKNDRSKKKWRRIIFTLNYISYIWFSGFALVVYITNFNKDNTNNLITLIILAALVVILHPYILSNYLRNEKEDHDYSFSIIDKDNLEHLNLYYIHAITNDLLLLSATKDKNNEDHYIYDRGEKVYYHIKKV